MSHTSRRQFLSSSSLTVAMAFGSASRRSCVGTPHAADIAFKFNNVSTPGPFSGSRPERLIASRNMAELWTSFARTGRPAAAGQPAWPPYDLVRRPTMRIDTATR